MGGRVAILTVMRLISQQEALGVGELGAGEAARLWREPRHDGLDCLAARFRTHRYSTHTHETYVIGVITAGCEGYWLRGETRRAAAGRTLLRQSRRSA
jgi:AraC-like ligand binding domain